MSSLKLAVYQVHNYKPCENGKYTFLKQASHWSLDQRVLFGSLLHYVSTLPCQYTLCRVIYVFYLSCNPTKPLRWDVILIHMWELLTACNLPPSEKYGDHRHVSTSTSKMYILARSAPKLKKPLPPPPSLWLPSMILLLK